MNALIRMLVNNYRKWDFLVFALLTTFAVITGNTSVFYIIYFFWWNELIRIIVDKSFFKRNPNITLRETVQAPLLGSLFQMGIYFMFIVVFFGVIANWGNEQITYTNMEILFFKNWFFNSNLLFILVDRIFLHLKKQPIVVSFGHFTPNMIILHLSIIIGGILMFFIVKNYPETFTKDNLWGAVIIILPFVLLKMLIENLTAPAKKK